MFKQQFKYYKSRNPPPDLTNVLNFNCINLIQDKVKQVRLCDVDDCEKHILCGLKPIQQWEAYELINNPGLIFIRNPFTSSGQRYWTVRCLRDYTKHPNKLNLDIHGVIPENEHWWEMCQNSENKKLVDKLRWATLGYHHNWDTKVYTSDSKGDFPLDLAELSKYVARVLRYKDFNAEAAIVNYYHMDSTLSGHTDHSEQYLEAPLFSFSFGQSAIFLLGGTTLDIRPTAMFLHSGDIIVMSKESRLCYHGVPKIIGCTELLAPWNQIDTEDVKNVNLKQLCNVTIKECQDEIFWKPFREYLENSRININVRQVLKTDRNVV